MKELVYVCKVHSPQIMYVNSLLDSYEGIGIIRTVNEKTGDVVFYTTSDTAEALEHFLLSLDQECGIEIREIRQQEGLELIP
ncbi:DUF4911 domain-containing protein [Desulfurispirillum indicum]|uniref:DUF4911 domain-containing protein n=1 Tax=Desulfurispirillum indicum (strain ATCC BAA-1389 / DSM 22839 / S5) TaxID=653733 RepID=E6W4B4_DESIS|nr:DUF4911 domain-containing protein [Desulfurispirillum indicum]ADU65888.1 hypothetical protein Selin_1153 [Desulfurispirillum indicum S5]UCZ57823.1 DUF4911 domain-containing protein [Desulfurispirillum indicum]